MRLWDLSWLQGTGSISSASGGVLHAENRPRFGEKLVQDPERVETATYTGEGSGLEHATNALTEIEVPQSQLHLPHFLEINP